MVVERSEESVPPPLRRSRAWALAAFFFLVTSLWLPWWTVSYADAAGFEYEGVAVRPFVPDAPTTVDWAPHVTGVLVVAAAGWLFVRIAGRSHAYEPHAWRRDVCIQAAVVAVAWASALLWPDQVPYFWGGRTFTGDAGAFTETAMPGLGWWLALLSSLLLGVAWWVARPRTPTPPVPAPDRSMDSP